MNRLALMIGLIFLGACSMKRDNDMTSMDSSSIPPDSVVVSFDTVMTEWNGSSEAMKAIVSPTTDNLLVKEKGTILAQSFKNHDIVAFRSGKKDSLYRSLIKTLPQQLDSSVYIVGLDTYQKDLKSGKLIEKKFLQDRPLKGVPRKLNYIQWEAPLYEGSPFPIKVLLNDSENKSISGIKDYTVDIAITGVNLNYLKRDSVTIHEGNSLGDFLVNLKAPGVYKIVCSNKEMLPAEWYIEVLPIGKKKINYTPPLKKLVFKTASLQGPAATILVLVQTQRKVLADGIDQATLTFFLNDPDNLIDDRDSVRVLLECTTASLDRLELTIREGSTRTVFVTATQPGLVKIKLIPTNSRAAIADGNIREITFHPAIDRYQMRATPTVISLLEQAEIVFQLVNKEGRPIRSSENLEANVFVVPISGSGIVDPDKAIISSGDNQGRVTLYPYTTGDVQLVGTVDSLSEQGPQVVTIEWPVAATLYSAIGGLLGGLLLVLSGKKKNWWIPLLIGPITGFIAFWMAVFLKVAALSPIIVLNPLSVVVFGIIGGWLGVKIMKPLLSKLGFQI